MSGASSATARSEPIARRCGSEVMPPILPIPGPVRHRKPGGSRELVDDRAGYPPATLSSGQRQGRWIDQASSQPSSADVTADVVAPGVEPPGLA